MGREHWSHTSALCATIANANRPANRRAYTPDDFNPYAIRRRRTAAIEVTPETLPKFREAFIGRKDV